MYRDALQKLHFCLIYYAKEAFSTEINYPISIMDAFTSINS